MNRINYTKAGLIRKSDWDFKDDESNFKTYELILEDKTSLRVAVSVYDRQHYICFHTYDLDPTTNDIVVLIQKIKKTYTELKGHSKTPFKFINSKTIISH